MGNIALTLDVAGPAGLSGYNLTLMMENDSVAEWVGVEFPSWISSSDTCTFPASSIVLNASGVLQVEEGAGPVRLVTVQVRGITPGASPVAFFVYQIDDDNSAVMDIEAIPGVFPGQREYKLSTYRCSAHRRSLG